MAVQRDHEVLTSVYIECENKVSRNQKSSTYRPTSKIYDNSLIVLKLVAFHNYNNVQPFMPISIHFNILLVSKTGKQEGWYFESTLAKVAGIL